jgi:putative ATPase
MADDLFSAAVDERLARKAPLAARLRPRRLDEVVGQRHLLAAGKPLRMLIESDRLASVVLWGPAGTGKTSIARLVAGATSKAFEPMSAVNAGVKDVREVVERARERLGQRGQGTILFLDEVHRFNRTQQDALLPHVEEGLLVLVGATTENPYFSLTGPLLSRSTLFRLEALGADDLAELIDRALTDTARGLGDEPAEIDADARAHLASRAEGDARHVLTCLELAHALAIERAKHNGDGAEGTPRITLVDAEAALAMRALRYGDDEHYDVTSAFIKSMRGSDPDAAVYWLARMLEAGEDPRFIARRVVIFASEDVGLADPHALPIATAAADAVEYVGLPEARINLAHAVVYCALAPKSNASYMALSRAMAAVRDRPAGAVPVHLRDASYPSAKNLGHGQGYQYPHDAATGWVEQEYRPPEVAHEQFYRPGAHGAEGAIVDDWRARRGELPDDVDDDGDDRGGP